MIRNTVTILFLLISCSYCALGQSDGTITGSVLDERGDPVLQAGIHIQPSGQASTPFGDFALVYTDAQGRFVVPHLKWGSYGIYAMKTKDGYPDSSSFLFYKNSAKPATAVLSESHVLDDVTIQLGPKLGRLTNIHVADAISGRPITVTDPTSGKLLQIAGVTLIRNDIKNAIGEPVRFSAGAGVLTNILVPVDMPVMIKVGAAGYVDWYYPGTSDPAKAQLIRLKSGEDLSFDVLLQLAPEQ